MPQVSVLMSVYNDASYLREAIDSILDQDFQDLEFIVVDDGSTDDTPKILNHYTDPRLVILTNPKNIGLTRSLNRGLTKVRGQYIARMDANDISCSDRLRKQVAFLDDHPKVGVLSGDMVSIAPDGNRLFQESESIYSQHATHMMLKWDLLWTNPIAHITVMIRRQVLEFHNITYQPSYNRAEDYELWATLSHYTQLVRLPEVYALRRVLPTGISFTKRQQQLDVMYQVMSREINLFLNTKNTLGTQCLFDVIHNNLRQDLDFMNAAKLVQKSYESFMKFELTPSEYHYIKQSALALLLKIAYQARPFSKSTSLYILAIQRTISWHQFLSRNTVYHVKNVFFQS